MALERRRPINRVATKRAFPGINLYDTPIFYFKSNVQCSISIVVITIHLLTQNKPQNVSVTRIIITCKTTYEPEGRTLSFFMVAIEFFFSSSVTIFYPKHY